MPAQYPPGFFHEIAETGEFGPLMTALNVRQRAWVLAFCAIGGGEKDATQAARIAGYSAKSAISLRVHAHTIVHNPKIQGALHEYGRARLQANAPAYMRELHFLATNRKAVKPEIRLKAALGGLSRAGFGGEINVNQNHTITISYDEKIAELRRLAALAGDDPDKAIEGLVAPQDMLPGSTEAEYEEIA